MGSGMGWLGGSTIFFLEACNNYHGLGGGWLSRVGGGEFAFGDRQKEMRSKLVLTLLLADNCSLADSNTWLTT